MFASSARFDVSRVLPARRSPRRGQSCVDALPDQVALELGQRPEDVEDELAAVGGSVILLGQPPIADPPLSEDQGNFDQKQESTGDQAAVPTPLCEAALAILLKYDLEGHAGSIRPDLCPHGAGEPARKR